MNIFHYDDYGVILGCEDCRPLHSLSKDTQTRTITNPDGFKKRLSTKDLKVSPRTYWNMGTYCQMFEAIDAFCYLCEAAFYVGTGCNCDSHGFTVEQHNKNVETVRRNYLISVIENSYPDFLSRVKLLPQSQVDELLYDDSEGYRKLMVEHPPMFDYRENHPNRKRIEKYLDKKLKQLRK